MERAIRVFLADKSQDYLALLRAAFEREPDILLVDAADRGDMACERLMAQSPDVLVTDLLLPGLDGVSLLRRLKNEGKLPRTLVVSAFASDRIAQEISRLGVEDYLLKPCDVDALVRRIREVADPDRPKVIREYTQAIRQALLNFGIMPNLNGYHYLMEGTRRALEDRNVLHGITKILYPDLAKHFSTTAPCIERSIRGAVESAWERGTPESRRQFFDGLFDGFDEAPGNARFINAITEFIEGEYEKVDIWKG